MKFGVINFEYWREIELLLIVRVRMDIYECRMVFEFLVIIYVILWLKLIKNYNNLIKEEEFMVKMFWKLKFCFKLWKG